MDESQFDNFDSFKQNVVCSLAKALVEDMSDALAKRVEEANRKAVFNPNQPKQDVAIEIGCAVGSESGWSWGSVLDEKASRIFYRLAQETLIGEDQIDDLVMKFYRRNIGNENGRYFQPLIHHFAIAQEEKFYSPDGNDDYFEVKIMQFEKKFFGPSKATMKFEVLAPFYRDLALEIQRLNNNPKWSAQVLNNKIEFNGYSKDKGIVPLSTPWTTESSDYKTETDFRRELFGHSVLRMYVQLVSKI